MQGKNSRSANDALNSLPQIEDGGLDDRTVASPALGFGMERSNTPMPPDPTDTTDSQNPQEEASSKAQGVIRPPLQAHPHANPQSMPRLSRGEVAAISVDERSFYVTDVPSPYLSSRMANEDIHKTRRRHARTAAIVTILFILAVLGVSGWFLWQTMHKEVAAALPEYVTTTIEHGEFLETVEATSLLRPADEEGVSAGISGKIAEMLVQDGAQVNEGDEICHLNNPTITDSYNKARQAYDTAVANVDAKARALDEANRALSSAQAAAASQTPTTNSTTTTQQQQQQQSQSTAAQGAVTNAQAKVQSAQNEYNRATESLHSIESTLQLAQEQQDLLTIHAPITGTVNNMNAQATVDAGVTGSTHLCTITDSSQLSLQVEIPDDVRPRVSVGQEVRITFPSIEDLSVTTTIDSFEDDETKQVANVLIKEPDQRLQKGTTAAASVIVQSVPDSLIVPLETIQHDKNNAPFLEILLDPTRDIKANIPIQIVATNKTKAAVAASNIQEGNTVIIPRTTQPSASDGTTNAQPVTTANNAASAQPPAANAPADAQPQGEQPQGDQPQTEQPQGEQPQAEQPAPQDNAPAA